MPIETKLVEAAGESYDDYILYEILCDYCDEEYTIRYMMEDKLKRPSIEACAFCGNPIEEPEESIIDDDEDSWD